MKLVIIDFYNYLYRAYYGIRPLSTTSGQQVNAVYGMATMVNNLKKTYKPDQIVAVLEGGSSWRSQEYSEYKANRKPMPEELRSQIELVKELFTLLQIPMINLKTYEADDVIASIASQANATEVLIASGDKDLMQLVNDKIKIVDSMKNKIYDATAVEEKFGVKPEQLVDYLSLVGDSSDNVPGAEGIGGKTAVKIILDYGSIENLLSSSLPEKLQAKILASKDNIILSKKLVALNTSLQTDFSLKKNDPIKIEDLNKFLLSLEMKSLLNKF